MKKKKYIICALVIANLAVLGVPKLIAAVGGSTAETNAVGECLSGGVGSNSCSIDATIGDGLTVAAGCSVNCSAGTYACCNFHGCHCVRPGEVQPPIDFGEKK